MSDPTPEVVIDLQRQIIETLTAERNAARSAALREASKAAGRAAFNECVATDSPCCKATAKKISRDMARSIAALEDSK